MTKTWERTWDRLDSATATIQELPREVSTSRTSRNSTQAFYAAQPEFSKRPDARSYLTEFNGDLRHVPRSPVPLWGRVWGQPGALLSFAPAAAFAEESVELLQAQAFFGALVFTAALVGLAVAALMDRGRS